MFNQGVAGVLDEVGEGVGEGVVGEAGLEGGGVFLDEEFGAVEAEGAFVVGEVVEVLEGEPDGLELDDVGDGVAEAVAGVVVLDVI